MLPEKRIKELADEAEWELMALCRKRSTKATIAATIRDALKENDRGVAKDAEQK